MWQHAYALEALWLFLMLLLLLAVSRAAAVVPLVLVHNWWSKDVLSTRDTVIVWWSGMIRGAVSVALVYHHFDKSSAHSGDDRHRSTLIVTTLMVVLFSVLGYGAVTKPLMQLMLGGCRARLPAPAPRPPCAAPCGAPAQLRPCPGPPGPFARTSTPSAGRQARRPGPDAGPSLPLPPRSPHTRSGRQAAAHHGAAEEPGQRPPH
jgi:hypothetical protein